MLHVPLLSLHERVRHLRTLPPRISRRTCEALLGPSIFLTSRLDFGRHIYEEEWDLLIILDTCRPDALRAVADEYEFIDDVSECWSVGGDSWEWLANTFDRRYFDEIRSTAYVTSNPNAKTVLEHGLERNHEGEPIEREKVRRLKRYGALDPVSPNEFGTYESLYECGVEQGHGAYPSPRTVTDHGIETLRTDDFDRVILHYMPPHWPFIAERVDEDTSAGGEATETQIELRDEPRDVTWEAYLDNLRWGLSEVRLLLRNVDSETVVITADHGESFSKYLPPHRAGSPDPSVRKVPWVVTTAEDTGTYDPDIRERDSQYSADEVMDALGYTV